MLYAYHRVLIAKRRYPKAIRVDHGSELVNRDLDLWPYAMGII
jgi:hypothetical protein